MSFLFALVLSFGDFLSTRFGQFSIVISIAVVIYNNVMDILNRIHALIALVDSVVKPSMSSATSIGISPLGLMNYILPVDLICALIILWVPFWLGCVTIRIIKSFVPTVAS